MQVCSGVFSSDLQLIFYTLVSYILGDRLEYSVVSFYRFLGF